jgi:hypothetical protein
VVDQLLVLVVPELLLVVPLQVVLQLAEPVLDYMRHMGLEQLVALVLDYMRHMGLEPQVGHKRHSQLVDMFELE